MLKNQSEPLDIPSSLIASNKYLRRSRQCLWFGVGLSHRLIAPLCNIAMTMKHFTVEMVRTCYYYDTNTKKHWLCNTHTYTIIYIPSSPNQNKYTFCLLFFQLTYLFEYVFYIARHINALYSYKITCVLHSCWFTFYESCLSAATLFTYLLLFVWLLETIIIAALL